MKPIILSQIIQLIRSKIMTTTCAFCGAFEPHNYKHQWVKLPLRVGVFYLCSYRCEEEFNKLTYEQKKQTPQARALLKEQETKRKLEQELETYRSWVRKLQQAQIIFEIYPIKFDDPIWVKHTYNALVELFTEEKEDDDYWRWED